MAQGRQKGWYAQQPLQDINRDASKEATLDVPSQAEDMAASNQDQLIQLEQDNNSSVDNSS